MEGNKYQPVGIFSQTQGDEGELILKLFPSFPEEIDLKKEPVFLPVDNDEEDPVPFFVEYVHPRKKGTLAIKLEDVDSLQRAEDLIGLKVLLPTNYFQVEKVADDLQHFLDYRVLDQDQQELGIVTGFLDYPGNPLLQVEGANGEVLVPVHEDLIISIDQEKRQLLVELPEGFLNIND